MDAYRGSSQSDILVHTCCVLIISNTTAQESRIDDLSKQLVDVSEQYSQLQVTMNSQINCSLGLDRTEIIQLFFS